MSDYISRQAVSHLEMDEMRDYQTFNLDDAYEQGFNDCLKSVLALPSAQMDSACVGCRYERKGSVVCDDCSRFFLDRYERMEEE